MADTDPDLPDELLALRGSIDNLDAAIVHIMAERFKFTKRVGELKAAHGLPAADPERERRQITRLRALADQADLDPEFAEKLLNFIVSEVVQHHLRIADNHNHAAPGQR
ncbi:MAG: chorismate mutase [Brooklawnia sp.]|uniref:chorismate mutase n=1 Tax=Brooklawnia sp. TaxID=2699740 RepID=UPI003C736060